MSRNKKSKNTESKFKKYSLLTREGLEKELEKVDVAYEECKSKRKSIKARLRQMDLAESKKERKENLDYKAEVFKMNGKRLKIDKFILDAF